MHLARRGGHKSEKRILPADVDGRVQSLRLQLIQQDAQHIPSGPPATKPNRRFQYVRVKEKSKASGARTTLVDTSSNIASTNPPGEEGRGKPQHIPIDVVNNLVNNMGAGASGETICVAISEPTTMKLPSSNTPTDLRGVVPADLLTVNTTAMEGAARKLVHPDDQLLTRETHAQTRYPAEPIISPQMEAADRWCARSQVPLPEELLPVIKHRILNSMPDDQSGGLSEDWMYTTLGEALTFVSKTGPKKEAQKALAGLAVLHDVHPIRARDGRTSPPIHFGELVTCTDYTAQRVSIGELVWESADFGELLPLGDKLRQALSEGEKN